MQKYEAVSLFVYLIFLDVFGPFLVFACQFEANKDRLSANECAGLLHRQSYQAQLWLDMVTL